MGLITRRTPWDPKIARHKERPVGGRWWEGGGEREGVKGSGWNWTGWVQGGGRDGDVLEKQWWEKNSEHRYAMKLNSIWHRRSGKSI